MVKKFILLTIVFFKGMKFFETCHKPLTNGFREAKFITVSDRVVKFSFFKEKFKNLHYIRGQIVEDSVVVFLIQCKFDEGMPAELSQFNNLKFIFHGWYIGLFDDDVICETLLSIYLKFIKRELQLQKKKLI